MAEPTHADVDALVGPATPHFAYQLRARLRGEPRSRPGWSELPSSAPADAPLPHRR